MKKKINKKKEDKEVPIVTRGVRINTPHVQVELQSNDGRETLKDMKKMAEDLIDKYKQKCDGDYR